LGLSGMFWGGQNIAFAAMVMRVVEAFLITAGLLICISYLTGQQDVFATTGLVIPLIAAFAVVVVLQVSGLYGGVTVSDLRTSLWRIGMDTALGFILAVIASGQLAKYDLVKIYPYRWQWTIGLTAVWLLCVIARRQTLSVLLEKGLLARKIIAVSDADGSRRLAELSRRLRGRFVVAAEMEPVSAFFDAKLTSLVSKLRAPEVVISAGQKDELVPAATVFQRMTGIPVVDFDAFYERETGQVELACLPERWPFPSREFQTPLLRAAKRIFDVTVSLVAIAATAPVMALAALAIRMEDGKPVLFRQTRIGLNGCEFTLYKFRSMRVDAENGSSPLWAAENDPRITRVGSIIRKFRIDELPQFFNTLRGDMSFIGPRPERPYFVEQLADVIPCYKARHTVRPGITGWAQVSYHYGASFEDAYQKTAFDLYYVKHQSVLLDLIILARTVKVILWPTGAR